MRTPAPGEVDDDVHHVVVGILRSRGRTLLCHRAPERRWYPNVWDFPGGHIEEGEAPHDALRRELREELGIDAETVSETPVARIAGAGLTLRAYVVVTWSGSVQNCSPEEHDEIGWFVAEEVDSLELAHPAFPGLLHDLEAGRLS